MEEEVKFNTMCLIEGTGEIFDVNLSELPPVGHRLQIGNRNLRVIESHESVSPQFKFVITLSR